MLVQSPTQSPARLTVRTAPLGVDVVIESIGLDERHRFRMLELGLRSGTVVRVIQKANFGGRVVAKGYERIAIDGKTAAAIGVAVAHDAHAGTASPADDIYVDPGHRHSSPADRETAADWKVEEERKAEEDRKAEPAGDDDESITAATNEEK
ncbi:FeoA family protein [Bifidobacterium choloepi]|uniref:Ferrous iron transport protein A n=1 Tax=Bifidobacterium choloepi TaxID=2614131 RepID=A0A6I5MYI7_9BIFI|nr:FeoA family protein [Bifidobacterium choloepi]NEG69337.1 ferrous iron transport protein A [Bifidobacterium choloepi]